MSTSERGTNLSIPCKLFVVGALFVACVTVREFSLINLAALVVTDLRVTAFGANPNELGLAMAVTVPVSLFLVRLRPRGISLFLNGAYLVIGPVAVFLTASRGAVIALGLSVVGMAVMLRDMRGAAKSIVIVAVVIIGSVGVSLIPSYTWERIGSIGVSLQRMDFNNRAGNWSAGIDYFLGQPLLGVGAGAFQGATKHLLTTSWSSHSTWVGVLVETGLIGAALWGGAIALILGLKGSQDLSDACWPRSCSRCSLACLLLVGITARFLVSPVDGDGCAVAGRSGKWRGWRAPLMKILCVIDHFGSGGAQRQMVVLGAGAEGQGARRGVLVLLCQIQFLPVPPRFCRCPRTCHREEGSNRCECTIWTSQISPQPEIRLCNFVHGDSKHLRGVGVLGVAGARRCVGTDRTTGWQDDALPVDPFVLASSR
ncbi:MAG: O-antigen ligase family protein [Proteobacteria bacterium]|nr:O-antigen ligase family protein [Pseudomonadota bacterium]